MEAEGFTVYEAEWWHFDYKDWQRYRIGNERFEKISHANEEKKSLSSAYRLHVRVSDQQAKAKC